MKLSRAFDVRDKDVVAFVGGGGKTGAMFRLARELSEIVKRVVVTTTTRIFAAQIALAPAHLRLADSSTDLDRILAALAQHPNLLVVGGTDDSGKALGVPPELVDALIRCEQVDHVIVEADGSRMRPFKAPASHEPVIPSSTTLLVPVVGIDVLDKLLDDTHVHRAELVAQLANVPLGKPVTIETVARVLADSNGGLRHKTAQARVIPLINKVESASTATQAQELAVQLLQADDISAVAVGAIKNADSPISKLVARVSAIILAAGGSMRMQGALKQLLPWGDTTFVGNAVQVAQQSQAAQVVVVTGSRADEVERELRNTGVKLVHNPAWESGRASSVRAGISAIDSKSAAAIFINADQPFLTAQVIDALLERYFETRVPIVMPTFHGEPGSPVLFARELFPEFDTLTGEQGGRDILLGHEQEIERVEISDVRAAVDLDTPQDYQAARKMVDDA